MGSLSGYPSLQSPGPGDNAPVMDPFPTEGKPSTERLGFGIFTHPPDMEISCQPQVILPLSEIFFFTGFCLSIFCHFRSLKHET